MAGRTIWIWLAGVFTSESNASMGCGALNITVFMCKDNFYKGCEDLDITSHFDFRNLKRERIMKFPFPVLARMYSS
jgi:hypothetical protein